MDVISVAVAGVSEQFFKCQLALTHDFIVASFIARAGHHEGPGITGW